MWQTGFSHGSQSSPPQVCPPCGYAGCRVCDQASSQGTADPEPGRGAVRVEFSPAGGREDAGQSKQEKDFLHLCRLGCGRAMWRSVGWGGGTPAATSSLQLTPAEERDPHHRKPFCQHNEYASKGPKKSFSRRNSNGQQVCKKEDIICHDSSDKSKPEPRTCQNGRYQKEKLSVGREREPSGPTERTYMRTDVLETSTEVPSDPEIPLLGTETETRIPKR